MLIQKIRTRLDVNRRIFICFMLQVCFLYIGCLIFI
ncbi:Uncharacterised protein [Vibrio cholerae]|nr:Uncharacterised protein [Vibrio cholerae]